MLATDDAPSLESGPDFTDGMLVGSDGGVVISCGTIVPSVPDFVASASSLAIGKADFLPEVRCFCCFPVAEADVSCCARDCLALALAASSDIMSFMLTGPPSPRAFNTGGDTFAGGNGSAPACGKAAVGPPGSVSPCISVDCTFGSSTEPRSTSSLTPIGLLCRAVAESSSSCSPRYSSWFSAEVSADKLRVKRGAGLLLPLASRDDSSVIIPFIEVAVTSPLERA